MPVLLVQASRATWPARQGQLSTSTGARARAPPPAPQPTHPLPALPARPLAAGATPISLFSLSPYGVPVSVWAAIYMLVAAPFLLPRGAGARGARRLWNKLRRRGEDEGEGRAGQRGRGSSRGNG